jgi:hypothetical protein
MRGVEGGRRQEARLGRRQSWLTRAPSFATLKGGDFKALQAYCREKSLASAERIWKIAETSKDERLAFMAYAWLVERGWGKPKDFDPKDEAPIKPRFDPRLLSREQLEIVQYALRLMVQATRGPGDVETVIDEP